MLIPLQRRKALESSLAFFGAIPFRPIPSHSRNNRFRFACVSPYFPCNTQLNPLPPQKRYPFRGSYSKEPAIHSAFPTHCSSDGTENHAIQTSCDTYERYRSSLRVVPNPAPKPVDLGPIPGILFHSHSCILCTLLHTFQWS